MKRFLVSVLCVSIFFVGLGKLVEKAGAAFRSDEKALTLMRAARQAIGGDSAVAGVRSMTIAGKTTHVFKVNGSDRTELGETEIALQMPDKFTKIVRMGKGDGATGEKAANKEMIVIRNGADVELPRIPREPGEGQKRVIVRTLDGETEDIKGDTDGTVIIRKGDGEKRVVSKDDIAAGDEVIFHRVAGDHHAVHGNELIRATLSLLLSAPEGVDISYTFVGEGNVDGTSCNIVRAEGKGTDLKLYLSKETNLPVMMSYMSNEFPRVMHFKEKLPEADLGKDKIFVHKMADAVPPAEVQVKFADYRSVGGVQLPYRWTKSAGAGMSETFEVTSYELNPADIAEKFQQRKPFRVKVDVQK